MTVDRRVYALHGVSYVNKVVPFFEDSRGKACLVVATGGRLVRLLRPVRNMDGVSGGGF